MAMAALGVCILGLPCGAEEYDEPFHTEDLIGVTADGNDPVYLDSYNSLVYSTDSEQVWGGEDRAYHITVDISSSIGAICSGKEMAYVYVYNPYYDYDDFNVDQPAIKSDKVGALSQGSVNKKASVDLVVYPGDYVVVSFASDRLPGEPTEENPDPQPSLYGYVRIDRVTVTDECGCDDTAKDGSIDVSIHMGKDTKLDAGGLLELHILDDEWGERIYSPNELRIIRATGLDLKYASNTLRQVKTSQTLVDVANVTSDGYELKFYAASQISGTSGGLYTLTGGATPYKVWKFADDNDSDGTRMLVTEVVGSKTNTYFYEWHGEAEDAGDKGWDLTRSTNATEVNVEKHFYTYVGSGPARSVQSETREIYNAGGSVLAFKQKDMWTTVDGRAVVANTTLGSGLSGNHFTSYTYWSSGGDNYLQPQTVTEPYGHWTYYNSYSNRWGVLQRIEQYLNNASNTTWSGNPNHKFELALSDTDTLKTYTETLQGAVVGLRWHKVETWGSGNGPRKITDAVAISNITSAWDDSSNLKTVTYLYDATNTSGKRLDAPFLIVRPDRTATKYEYYTNSTIGNITTVTWEGYLPSDPSSNSYSANITKGTKTTTVTDRAGNLLSSATIDIESDLTIMSKVATAQDAQGRATTISYFGGTYTEQFEYDCCADTLMTDRYGSVTGSTFDAARRMTQQVKFDSPGGGQPSKLTTNYQYNGAGQQTRISLVDGGNSSLTRNTTNTYNTAGELTSTLDPLSRNTTFSISANGSYVAHTTTYPDKSVKLELYYQDGSLYQVRGSAVHGMQYTYGVEGNGARTVTMTPIDSGGSLITSANVTEYTDIAGRPWKTVAPSPTGSGSVTTENFYNSKGQLYKTTRTGQPTLIYSYDDLGRRSAEGLDINGGDTLSGASGTDRETDTTISYTTYNSATARQVTTIQWITSGGGNITTTTYTAVDGSGSTTISDGLTTSTEISVNTGSKTVTQTTTLPDTTQMVVVIENGRKTSETLLAGNNAQLGATTFAYNGYGEIATQTDARNGATTFTYDAVGRPTAITLPDPDGVGNGVGTRPQTITYAYNTGNVAAGQYSLETITARKYGGASGTVVEASRQQTGPMGEVLLSYGASGYAAQHTYDYAGRELTLTTWQGFNSGNLAGSTGSAVTSWGYNAAGAMLYKVYNDGTSANFTYDSGGRLATRQWARSVDGSRVTTTWAYNGTTGDLANITYSGNMTPGVTYGSYDRLGRPGTVADGAGTRSLTYEHGQLTVENYTAGDLAGYNVTRTLDGVYRLGELALTKNGTTVNDATYAWNTNTGRLSGVTTGSEVANFTYVSDSSLVQDTTFKHSASTKLTTSRSYDTMNRLASIAHVPAGTGGNSSVAYAYNDRNQRISATRDDGTAWNYGYDSDGDQNAVGQIVVANVTTNTSVVIPGLDVQYSYDTMGNRLSGNTNPGNATLKLTGNYFVNTTGNSTQGANALNQYGSRQVPRKLEVMGSVAVNSTVTVNGVTANITGNTFWFQPLSFTGNASRLPTITVNATKSGNTSVETGKMFLPAHPEVFAHDADGNMLSDGRWSYVYDAENRLAAMVTGDSAAAAGVERQTIVFNYDSNNRKVAKNVYDWNPSGNGTWVLVHSVKFLYDGWNLVAEMNAMPANQTVVRTYVWGPDLSGTMQGAGGVGGLLMGTLNDGSSTQTVYYGADGNGNVITLADTSGNIVGSYDYDPFGKVVRSTGTWAAFNPIRFSTKYSESGSTYAGRDTGLVYYGRRFYSPGLGRFVNRDPIEEEGGGNLYAICGNNLINCFDAFGTSIGVAVSSENYFSDEVKEAFESLVGSGAGLHWEKITLQGSGAVKAPAASYSYLRLAYNGNGSSELWGTLKGAIDSLWTFILIHNSDMRNNALNVSLGVVQSVFLSPNAEILLPEITDASNTPDGGPFDFENAPFAITLWHEAIGHGYLGYGHPQKEWNTRFGGGYDPTIEEENRARRVLGINERAYVYFGDTRWGPIVPMAKLCDTIEGKIPSK